MCQWFLILMTTLIQVIEVFIYDSYPLISSYYIHMMHTHILAWLMVLHHAIPLSIIPKHWASCTPNILLHCSVPDRYTCRMLCCFNPPCQGTIGELWLAISGARSVVMMSGVHESVRTTATLKLVNYIAMKHKAWHFKACSAIIEALILGQRFWWWHYCSNSVSNQRTSIPFFLHGDLTTVLV